MTDSGRLFVFEGPDGVGKTTMAKNLTRSLQASGVSCEYVAFPGASAGTLGLHVYRLHHHPEAFDIHDLNPSSLQVLHLAAHIEAIEGVILPRIRQGTTVILDRYWWSMRVYGGVSGIPSGSLDSMVQLEKSYWGDTMPTIAFLLSRKQENATETIRLLATAYADLAAREAQRHWVELVSTDESPEETLVRVLASCRNSNASTLTRTN